MRDLTHEELLNAPTDIQFIYLMSIRDQPIGSKIVKDALENHPEYFPDEIEHSRKWALIPQSVHDEYWVERERIHLEVFKDMPPSKGILGWIMDSDIDGYNKWNDEYKKLQKIEQPLIRKLHFKFYSPYGIEFNEW